MPCGCPIVGTQTLLYTRTTRPACMGAKDNRTTYLIYSYTRPNAFSLDLASILRFIRHTHFSSLSQVGPTVENLPGVTQKRHFTLLMAHHAPSTPPFLLLRFRVSCSCLYICPCAWHQCMACSLQIPFLILYKAWSRTSHVRVMAI